MKTRSTILQFFLFFLSLLLSLVKPDPHALQDYCVADTKNPRSFFINGAPCINPNLTVSDHFATSVLAKPGKTNLFGFNVTLTTISNLPGLNTMGLIMARVDIAADGVVPPHSHPRASEVTICLKGTIIVGFVDTVGRLFTRQLRPGDSFVFPKGLIHYLYNLDMTEPALALSGLSSQNPGAQIASMATFRSDPPLPDEVLRAAFQINNHDISRIRKNLGG